MINVSFVIPSYNSCRTIQRTVTSILQLKRFDCVQDIVIVDSSDDLKTRQILKGLNHDRLKIVFLDKKTDPAQGRNIGAQNAAGSIFCFIDSDVYLDALWLDSILTAYSNGCRAGGGAVLIPDFQSKNAVVQAQYYLQLNEFLPVGDNRSVSLVPGCNMFTDRVLFEKVGGFPDLRASEDTLFCLKLAKFEKIWFIPSAKCFHVFREEWEGFTRNQELLGKYISVYRRSHYKNWIYAGIIPVILFPAFLLLKMIRIVARIKKAGGIFWKQFVSSFGIFTLGLFCWSIGFIKGCFYKDEIVRR